MQLPVCKDCDKPCCTLPAVTHEEYMVMWEYIGNDRLQDWHPYFDEPTQRWRFRGAGCPVATDKGCLLPYADRPIMCRLFPFIPVTVHSDTHPEPYQELMLMVARCPQWRVFGELYNQAKEELDGKKTN